MAPSELAFRLDVVDDNPDLPSVTILVDGQDVIGRATGFQGFDPDELFGERAPLSPTDPPRRVALYRCSCGEPGCGCAACLISQEGETIRWSDFRDFTGVYAGPLVDANPEGGTRHPVPDLDFDAEQYLEAVERASQDRAWETARRRKARLLKKELQAHHAHFEKLGYAIGWIAPEGDPMDGMLVELRLPKGQVIVRLESDPHLDDETASAQMAAQLIATPESRWDVRHRNIRSSS